MIRYKTSSHNFNTVPCLIAHLPGSWSGAKVTASWWEVALLNQGSTSYYNGLGEALGDNGQDFFWQTDTGSVYICAPGWFSLTGNATAAEIRVTRTVATSTIGNTAIGRPQHQRQTR